MHCLKKLDRFMWEDVFLPLESVILFIGGMALAVTGVLLFLFSPDNFPTMKPVSSEYFW